MRDDAKKNSIFEKFKKKNLFNHVCTVIVRLKDKATAQFENAHKNCHLTGVWNVTCLYGKKVVDVVVVVVACYFGVGLIIDGDARYVKNNDG